MGTRIYTGMIIMDYTGKQVTQNQINRLREYLDSLPNYRTAPADPDNFKNYFQRMPKL